MVFASATDTGGLLLVFPAMGTIVGGIAAMYKVRSNAKKQVQDAGLSALKLALETYVNDNDQLRRRLDGLEEEVRECERSKADLSREVAGLRADLVTLKRGTP